MAGPSTASTVRRWWLCAGLLLLLGCREAPPQPRGTRPPLPPGVRILNEKQPGATLDLEKELVRGQTNILYFHASWCPQCHEVGPELEKLAVRRDDVTLLKVDLVKWESPVAEQFGIVRLPHLQVYDDKGELTSAGAKAFQEVERLSSAQD